MSSFTAINVKENEGEIDIEEHTRELQIESGYKLFQDALKFQKINDFKTANKLYDELFKMDIIKSNNYSANPNIENLKYLCYRNIGFLKFYELVSDCSERRKKNNQSNGNTTKKKEQNADGADQNKENNERKHEDNKQFETNENSETFSQSIKSVENDKAEKSDTKVKIEEGDKFFNNIEGDVTRDIIEINNEIEPSDQEVYDRLLSLVENLITSLNHGDADSELIELLYSIFKYYQLTKLERYSLEYMIMSNSSELSNTGIN
ncbi:unnamed protein product [[Candida] boidinii]|nr:unnamed protein product [[Candida] boidinii]